MKTIIKLSSICLLAATYQGCMITYNKSGQSFKHPNYHQLSRDTISILYFTHAQANISSLATAEVESVLNSCRNITIISAYKTEEYLHKAGLFALPQRFTKALADSLKSIIPGRYLMRGNINQWENPILGDNPEGPKVNITYELWDLQKGELVWTFSGGETSTASVFIITRAKKASTQMNKLTKRAFKTWKGLCVFPVDE